MKHTDDEPPEEFHQPTGHDEHEISISGVVKVCLTMVLVVASTYVIVSIVFRQFALREIASDPPLHPLAVSRPTTPPQPTLQVNEPADLAVIRETERNVLEGYGWIDKNAGIARIPVEAAMKMLVEKGRLPSSNASGDAGISMPQDSTGGRTVPK